MDSSNTNLKPNQDPDPERQAQSTTTEDVPQHLRTNINASQSPDPPPNPIVTEHRDPRVSNSGWPSGTSLTDRDKRDTKFSFRSTDQPLPPLPEDIDIDISPRRDLHPDPRSIPLNTRRISLVSGQPEVSWIIPRDDRPFRKKTAGERLDPTLITAIAEKERYAFKARLTGFALNAAIGMQVVLGALTTGLSVVTTGHQTQVMTAVLGGIATIVASYLARARGSNEPELSIARVKDLEQFIRDCEAFKMDRGDVVDDTEDEKVLEFRRRFEDLLGNASGERKLSA